MRLKDADALIERITNSAKNAKDSGAWPQYCTGLLTAAMYIDEAPIVEPKRGRWIERDEGDGDVFYECSVCGEVIYLFEGTPAQNNKFYCSQCGAKMDGDEADES